MRRHAAHVFAPAALRDELVRDAQPALAGRSAPRTRAARRAPASRRLRSCSRSAGARGRPVPRSTAPITSPSVADRARSSACAPNASRAARCEDVPSGPRYATRRRASSERVRGDDLAVDAGERRAREGPRVLAHQRLDQVALASGAVDGAAPRGALQARRPRAPARRAGSAQRAARGPRGRSRRAGGASSAASASDVASPCHAGLLAPGSFIGPSFDVVSRRPPERSARPERRKIA